MKIAYISFVSNLPCLIVLLVGCFFLTIQFHRCSQSFLLINPHSDSVFGFVRSFVWCYFLSVGSFTEFLCLLSSAVTWPRDCTTVFSDSSCVCYRWYLCIYLQFVFPAFLCFLRSSSTAALQREHSHSCL